MDSYHASAVVVVEAKVIGATVRYAIAQFPYRSYTARIFPSQPVKIASDGAAKNPVGGRGDNKQTTSNNKQQQKTKSPTLPLRSIGGRQATKDEKCMKYRSRGRLIWQETLRRCAAFQKSKDSLR